MKYYMSLADRGNDYKTLEFSESKNGPPVFQLDEFTSFPTVMDSFFYRTRNVTTNILTLRGWKISSGITIPGGDSLLIDLSQLVWSDALIYEYITHCFRKYNTEFPLPSQVQQLMSKSSLIEELPDLLEGL